LATGEAALTKYWLSGIAYPGRRVTLANSTATMRVQLVNAIINTRREVTVANTTRSTKFVMQLD
jgi:hypothetical protein